MERSQRKAHLIQQDYKLRYVVFDMIMWEGVDITQQPCKQRFDLLQTHLKDNLRTNTDHVRVIEDTKHIKTAYELVELLREATKLKLEGYVLKDPMAPYYFQKTRSIQKVKLTGPEINGGVVGVGFSLSTNPRRWGLLTAVKMNHLEPGKNHPLLPPPPLLLQDDSKKNLITYCRVEVLEGDNLNCAFEQVLICYSIVRVKDIQTFSNTSTASKKNKANATKKVIELDHYSVFVDTIPGTKWKRVEWKARNTEDEHHNCVLVIQEDALVDIQWICNPMECAFSLSLRGDIRPIIRTLQYGVFKNSNSTADKKKGGQMGGRRRQQQQQQQQHIHHKKRRLEKKCGCLETQWDV